MKKVIEKKSLYMNRIKIIIVVPVIIIREAPVIKVGKINSL